MYRRVERTTLVRIENTHHQSPDAGSRHSAGSERNCCDGRGDLTERRRDAEKHAGTYARPEPVEGRADFGRGSTSSPRAEMYRRVERTTLVRIESTHHQSPDTGSRHSAGSERNCCDAEKHAGIYARPEPVEGRADFARGSTSSPASGNVSTRRAHDISPQHAQAVADVANQAGHVRARISATCRR